MRSRFLAALLFAAGCSTALADQPTAPPPLPGPQIAIASAPAKVRAPYDVEIIREDGKTLPTYANKDRYYVQGNVGERYIIKVTNPTANRVEAVVTVDGIDVIDGEPGDLHKRGYVIPAYGETQVEGFRTSTDDVATFRFSSVDGSYAGQTGKARNVGVVAVAVFEEQHQETQQIIVGTNEEQTRKNKGGYDYRDDLDGDASAPRPTTTTAPSHYHGGAGDDAKDSNGRVANVDKSERRAPSPTPQAKKAPAPPPADAPSPNGGYGGVVSGESGGGGRGAPMHTRNVKEDERDYEPPSTPDVAQRTERPGLGTEFGENRYSAASYTRFVRNGDRPIAIAELRYNDGAGLTALGIQIQPMPDSGEIMQRETADPFPGDSHFSRRP